MKKITSISKLSKAVSSSDFDFGVGIREDAINDSFDAHFTVEATSPSSVYEGEGKIDELKLAYTYSVKAAPKLDIAPITQTRFKKIFGSWFDSVPELAKLANSPADAGTCIAGHIADAPPNVQVTASRINLSVQSQDGAIGVTLDFSIKITAYVQIEQLNGRTILRLTPIDARLDDPQALKKSLISQLAGKGLEVESSDCVSWQKLIIYIANVIIAGKVSQFVKEFELPVPIKVTDGLAITQVSLELVDNLLVVLARVDASQVAQFAPDEIFLNSPESLETAVSSLKQDLARVDAALKAESKKAKIVPYNNIASYPDRALFVVINESFLQKMADKLIPMAKDDEKCLSVLIVKFCYGRLNRVLNPTVE